MREPIYIIPVLFIVQEVAHCLSNKNIWTIQLFKTRRESRKKKKKENKTKRSTTAQSFPFGSQLTLSRLDAALMLMRATDSLFRLGRRLYPERWLVKELSEVTPGVKGPP